MKKMIGLSLLFFTITVTGGEYDTPACYEKVPTSCGFDEMTLSLCNQEGQPDDIKFSLSSKSYLPGGNKFTSSSGKTCLVKKIKDSEPAKYTVQIESGT
jgi:hypothetical protein